MVNVPNVPNEREELKERCLPNLIMQKCTFFVNSDVDRIIVYQGISSSHTSFGYISHISIKELYCNNNIALTIFDSETECKESVFVAVDKTVSRQSGVYEINNLPQLFIKGKTNK